MQSDSVMARQLSFHAEWHTHCTETTSACRGKSDSYTAWNLLCIQSDSHIAQDLHLHHSDSRTAQNLPRMQSDLFSQCTKSVFGCGVTHVLQRTCFCMQSVSGTAQNLSLHCKVTHALHRISLSVQSDSCIRQHLLVCKMASALHRNCLYMYLQSESCTAWNLYLHAERLTHCMESASVLRVAHTLHIIWFCM
jgi:hypothetical protein